MEHPRYKNGKVPAYAVFSFLLLLVTACASYYQKNEALMNAVYTYNFEAANMVLADDAKWEKQERNKLLFYLNKGTVYWMQGDAVNSNAYFAKADLFVEDYNKKVGDAVLTMLVNAKMTTYPGENFEQILLHYYGALNYLSLGKTDEALVEGKRMLEKMQKLSDRYEGKNKYKRDALAHHLIGIIYELKGEYNDAFIAYKNAYQVYREDYVKQLNTAVPQQLKKDILRTAQLTGFMDEVRHFESEFGFKAEAIDKEKPQVVFFWNNGLGPIKDQLSITIMIIPYNNGWVQFVNPELGISIPFRTNDDQQRKDMLDMKFIRLSLPKYISRVPYYAGARLSTGDKQVDFELVENINAIAFKSLEDRMGKELAVGLARVALKQLAVHKASQNKDNQGLAAAAMIYSVASEQADTRNWQLLPHSIHYSRIPIDTGAQVLKFEAIHAEKGVGATKDFPVNLKHRETKVLTVQTIEFAGYARN